MIEEQLKKLDLSDKEIAIFLAIYEHKKLSPPRIASLTGIKRSTVYAVSDELKKKGYIDSDTSGATTYYFAKDPNELEGVIKKEKRELEEKSKLIKELGQSLREIPSSDKHFVPKVKFIEHEENVKDFLYQRTPVWLESMIAKNKTWWGFQDHKFVENKEYREWIEWFWKNAPPEIDLKLLSNDSAIEESMKKAGITKRQIKFWKKSFKFTSTQWIVGDYSIMIVTTEKPHYIVEIHDPVYTKNMAELFSNLWEDI